MAPNSKGPVPMDLGAVECGLGGPDELEAQGEGDEAEIDSVGIFQALVNSNHDPTEINAVMRKLGMRRPAGGWRPGSRPGGSR